MSAYPIQAGHAVLPALLPTVATGVDASPLASRRRRNAAPQGMYALTSAGQGATTLTRQQLPFAVGASVRVGGSLLYPVVGAVLGTLLLGIPGTILGGIAGYFFSRR